MARIMGVDLGDVRTGVALSDPFEFMATGLCTITEYSGLVTSGVVLFALLLYSAFLWLAKRIAAKDSLAEAHKSLASGGIVLLAIVFTFGFRMVGVSGSSMVNTLQNGDWLVIAGKGHEDYQIIGKTKHHFDDREIAMKAMEQC